MSAEESLANVRRSIKHIEARLMKPTGAAATSKEMKVLIQLQREEARLLKQIGPKP